MSTRPGELSTVHMGIETPRNPSSSSRRRPYKNRKLSLYRTLRKYAVFATCAVLMSFLMLTMIHSKARDGLEKAFSRGRDKYILTAGKTSHRQMPLLIAPIDTFTAKTCKTRHHNGVIHIPAVRKGLNNQRMRIIQDIFVAHVLGMAVELPKIIRTRIDCHYQERCYQNYNNFVAFESVFDYADIVRRLKLLDICVVETPFSTTEVPILAGKDFCLC